MSDLIKRIEEITWKFNTCIAAPTLHKLLQDCKAEIERLSKPYVPMTDDEFYKIYCELYPDLIGPPERIFWQQDRLVETATIARYNEQRGVK